MTPEGVYKSILDRIVRVYEAYEDQANQRSEEKRRKTGATIDKLQKNFIEKLQGLEPTMVKTSEEVKKSKKIQGDDKDIVKIMADCLADVRSLLKKKTIMFKINKELDQLIPETTKNLQVISKDLAHADETGLLCCGGDGAKKFKRTIGFFKILAAKWKVLTLFEPKDSVENFISPPFKEDEYRFIIELLKKNWPANKVIEKIIPSEGKTSLLAVANQYIFGVNREPNIAYGLQLYHMEADRNDNPAAASYLGKVYEEGILLPKDLKKSLEYYQKGMNGQENYAAYRYAMILIRGENSRSGPTKQNIQKGFDILKDLASKKNPSGEAMTELGEIYEDGFFHDAGEDLFRIDRDLKKAVDFYKQARSLHLARASNNLGVLYFKNQMNGGDITDDSISKAIQYLQESRKQGFGQAFYNLGVIYSKEFRSLAFKNRDSEKVLQLFYQGALRDDYKSKIKFTFELMNQTSIFKEEFDDHYRLAMYWLQTVLNELSLKQEATHGDKKAEVLKDKSQVLFYLGLMYEHGFGVEKSPQRAFSHYIESGNLQYAPAKNKLGDCFFSGYGVKEDRQLAIGYYIEAEQLGSTDAMVNLGTIYLNGIPDLIEKNFTKAYKYFDKATKLENTDAMIHLSFMYKNELGLKDEDNISGKLLTSAAEAKNSTALFMLRKGGSGYDERVLFDHIDNEFMLQPSRLNLRNVVPVLQELNAK